MAGKKGGPQALQQEVNSDEDWRQMLDKEGLIVVDVYSEWCGPCLGMVGNLKKLKLEIGGDNLHLAVAKSDNITVLERFREKSEPTWMFIANSMMVRVIFGTNAPILMRAIEKELKLELKAMAGEIERRGYDFLEMTEDEKKRKLQIEEKERLEKLKAEKELAEQLDKIKRRTLERIARQLREYSLVLYFPHVIREPDENIKKRTCPAAYKMMVANDTINMSPVDQMDIMITPEMIPDLFFNTDMLKHLPESFLTNITKRACMATLLMYNPPKPEDEEEMYEPPPSPMEPMGAIEKLLATTVYGHMDPWNPLPETVCRMFLQENDKGEVIPPLWTPINFISKAAATKMLFPHFVEELQVPEDQLPPPSYVMIFEATKAKEILEASEPFVEDILHIGYFDSAEAESARKVAKTVYQLEKMGQTKVAESKMVLALKKVRSEPMLALSQYGPLYISHDLVTGTKELELFFPPKVEIEVEPDHWAAPDFEDILSEGVQIDAFGNQYVEEFYEDEVTGESILVRRLYKYPDGTSVEGFYQVTEDGQYIFRRQSEIGSKDLIEEEENLDDEHVQHEASGIEVDVVAEEEAPVDEE